MAWTFGNEIHALTNYDAESSTDSITGEDLSIHADQWLTDSAKDVIHALHQSLKIKCSTRASITDLNGMDLDG